MVEPQTTRFWQAALQSGLIDVAGLRKCWDALPEAKRSADAADRRLARQTVEFRLLTLWQAQQILGGRSSGFRIDKYVLTDLIGQGGMGRVYLAKDTRLNRQVALKVLSRERMNNPRAVARFRREAKVGAQLQHENLVRIYDEGNSRGVHYLVMEYIAGKNIGQILTECGPIEPSIATGLVRQIALGLEHARQKELIHRDVNPLNILVSREGIAKLTDLGLAIDLGDPEDIVTRDGATVGTFDYISPEQARHSRSVDTRSDIYSLGCTFYNMLTGRVPFPQPSLPEKLYAHQALDPEPPSAIVPGIPPGLEAVLQRMMRKLVDERYQTPLAVAQALEPYATPMPVPLDLIGTRALSVAATDGVHVEINGAAPTVTVAARIALSDSVVSPSPLGTTPNVSGSSASPPPTPSSHGSDPLVLIPKIDLGPVPPLSGTSSRVQKIKAPPTSLSPKAIVRVAAGVAALAIVAAVAVGYWAWVTGGKDQGTNLGPMMGGPKALPDGTGGSGSNNPDIVVHTSTGDFSETTLADAFRRAAGRQEAEIILRNRKPLEFEVNRPLELGEGKVTIRAADGARPVLGVILNGNEPFLRTNSKCELVLKGLTFEVVAGDRPSANAPVLIHAIGNLIGERCEFNASQSRNRDLHCVVQEGFKSRIEGCVFRGFEKPLIFMAHPQSEMRVAQSLFVRDQPGGTPSGWLVSAEHRSSRDALGTRSLTVDHCTVIAGGLIEAVGFSKMQELSVKVESTVLRSTALLLTSQDSFPSAVLWTGKANRYHVSGAAWVVLPPKGFDGLTGGPSDLKSWFAATKAEPETTDDPVRLAVEGNPPVESHPVADFALAGRDGDKGAGFDPARAGPPASANPK
jgi:eukaryotic-like serine/threonine-protein kinase